MNKIIRNLVIVISVLSISIIAADKKIEIGIDEQLGKKIPLNLTFKDEYGKDVVLKDVFTKPTALAFVYYECPGICSPLMTAIANVAEKTDLVPSKDFNIVTVSMDHTEKPELAADKKRNYMKMIEKDFPESAWRFLTGDSVTIKTLTDAAGFYFKKEGDEYIHSGALIFVNTDGKISRYLFPGYRDRGGYNILPFDFKMAVTETSKGNVVPTISNMLQFCFSYDPEGRTYVLNLTRIFGAGMLVLVAVFIVYLRVKPKKDRKTR
ncbi:MAG: SCO family protein [Ignavibacteriaceae bacterium]